MNRKQATRGRSGTVRCMAACAAAAVGLAAGGAFAAGAQPTKSEYGVIFHIDRGDQATIKKTLNNVENLLHDPRFKGRTLHIELLANSKGFEVYAKNNGFEKKLRALQGDGVELAQCANTLHELHIDRHDLYGFIKIVPSGMGEITIREAEGWAYIHPSSPPANQL